ncbi:nucleolin 2-like isoform X2 [Esox lucius]|uniref:nucleolin 2-like isoform X2 n=1 Tax=Esox lucius TaxID=8010 RepID=UPI0014769DDB|nr:nucleolin 2-like isoform X2 [Esox lucius]
MLKAQLHRTLEYKPDSDSSSESSTAPVKAPQKKKLNPQEYSSFCKKPSCPVGCLNDGMEIKRQKKCTKESRQRKNEEANSDWNARSETSKGALKPTSKKSPCLVSSDEKGDEKNVEGQKKRKDKISRDQKEPRQHSDGSLEDSMDSSEPTQSGKQEVKKHARKSRPTHQKDLDSGPEASEGASQVTQSSSKIMTSQQKKPWSSCEKEAVWKHLGKFKALKKVPGKQDILLCKGSEPALENRT